MKKFDQTDILMILPRKTVRSEQPVPQGWEVDQDASGISLTIDDQPSFIASWREAGDFGMNRPAIRFQSLDGKLKPRAFEVLVSRLAKAYDQMPSRYPLYIRLHSKELPLIAAASRLGFIPYFGNWKEQSAAQSESAWNIITENLREAFPEGYRA